MEKQKLETSAGLNHAYPQNRHAKPWSTIKQWLRKHTPPNITISWCTHETTTIPHPGRRLTLTEYLALLCLERAQVQRGHFGQGEKLPVAARINKSPATEMARPS